jgi:hypothetical protein
MIHKRFEAIFWKLSGKWQVWDNFLSCYFNCKDIFFNSEVECNNYILNIDFTFTTYFENNKGETYSSENHYLKIKKVKN